MTEINNQPAIPDGLEIAAKWKKFALISHILPPSPSGQAMILNHMLRPLPPDNYVLISTQDYANKVQTAFPPLPGTYRTLHALTDADIEASRILKFLRVVDADKPTLTRRLLRPFWRLYGYGRRKLKALLARRLLMVNRARQIQQIVEETACEAIIVCTGELYDLPAAYLASRRCKVPFFVYVMDDYKYQWTGPDRRFASLAEPQVMKGAQGVIVLNKYVQREYKRRYGIESTVIHVPAVLPDLDALDRQPPFLPEDTINIVYTGSVYHAHFDAFKNMVDAIASLGRADIRLHIFTGQPPEWLAEYGIKGDFITFHSHVPHEQVSCILRQADFLFLPLAFDSPIDELIINTSPSKMGEYLAVGKTIIVHTPPDSFLCDYFAENKCGVVVDQNDSAVLAEALSGIIHDAEQQQAYGSQAVIQARKDFEVTMLQQRFQQFLQTHLNRES